MSDITVRTTLHSFRKNMQTIKLIDLTITICQLLDVAKKTKLVSSYVDNIKKYLNVIPKCPLRKNFNYTLTGFHISNMELPAYVPEGKYKTMHILEYRNKRIADIMVWTHVSKLNKI
ncbi:uncharacterized protein [Musca autumnalis]|uniref:uncharacterized protein n=1 Tax=Musca autumnalis TaxID=221902 RepID=UPI003CEF33FE